MRSTAKVCLSSPIQSPTWILHSLPGQVLHNNEHSVKRCPLSALPTDLFALIFSSLRPQSIAKASEVSSSWRDVINGTPTLHQVVQLLKNYFKEPNGAKIVSYLCRLYSLSNHRISEIELDLELFCADFEENKQD